MSTKAIIYCRVSSERQVNEGHGLDGQELRCRQFAMLRGYSIEAVFTDEGISGGITDRPGIRELLEFLEVKAVFGEQIVIIIDDISRLARDVEAHFQLRTAIKVRNGLLQSPNHEFKDDDPYGKFNETIMAGAAELHRTKNRIQVIGNMRSRLESGYWPFNWMPGYVNKNKAGHRKVLVPVEPQASIIKEALEGFASGRFASKTDMRNFLQEKQFYFRKKTGTVHLSQATRLLERAPIYAGFIEYEPWGVKRREGHHEPLISRKTLELIEKRLEKSTPVPHRKDLHLDFPLRGYVACEECMKLMTASWSKGRGKRYPYYRCTSKGCSRYQKGVRKENLENHFEQLLEKMAARPEVLKLLEAVFNDLWKQRLSSFQDEADKREDMLKTLDKKIDDYLEKIETTKSKIIVEKYELRIEEIEKEKRSLKTDRPQKNNYRVDFGTALSVVLQFLQNPSGLWNTGRFEDKRTVLKLAFPSLIPFSKENGVGTASFSLLFELCKLSETEKSRVVEMPGIEPGSNV